MKKNWVIVIAVIIAVLIGWWYMKGGSLQYAMPSTSSNPVSSVAKTAAAPAVRKTPAPAATPAMSYSQLVQQYGSNRIQFDSSCQAQPRSVVFKNGTSIMLDNRSNQQRLVGLAGKYYRLPAYGYELVTLSGSVPSVFNLSCDNLVNVGTVNLEASIVGQ